MKKNFRYTLLLLSMLAMAACDEGFEELKRGELARSVIMFN